MIYVDFNSTTPLGEGAKTWMGLGMEAWGNPSSSHRLGRKSQELLNKSREALAESLAVKPSEVVFTSGGSESNALALLGSALQIGRGFKLLTSKVEHSSIRDTLKLLENLGAEIQFVALENDGQLKFDQFETQLTEFKPHLVSLMAANNETGVLFPIQEIARLCKAQGIRLHTDAVPAFGKISPSHFLDADLISVSAHKIYGPKGVGALIVRNGVQLTATHYGGSQEIKRRGGTENTIGIAGFGGACSELEKMTDFSSLKNLRDTFENILGNKLDGISIQGHRENRLANTSNIRFHGIPSEVLLSALDLEGIAVSAGSACSSGSISPSHVLLAMGLSESEAKECLRFSWGRTSTLTEAAEVAGRLQFHVERIRARNDAKAKTGKPL